METLTRKIRVSTLLGLLSTMLIACSHHEPAPWKQADDSPWSAKRGAERESASVNAGSTASDPVLIAETEPVPSEPVSSESVVEVEPVVIAAAPVAAEPLTPEQEVLAMIPSHYAVQVYASNTLESMERFKKDKGLSGLTVLKTDRQGKIFYVLVDFHADRSSAVQAAGFLEKKTGGDSWIRTVSSLQKIVHVE